jgi:hypothetical protein
VTEEDIRITEALIGNAFGRLKTSVAQAPHELVRPATSAIREHPFVTAAAAAGVGMAAYQLVRIVTPRVVVREVVTDTSGKKLEEKSQAADLKSQLLSLAMPYIVGYLQQELGKMMAGREASR